MYLTEKLAYSKLKRTDCLFVVHFIHFFFDEYFDFVVLIEKIKGKRKDLDNFLQQQYLCLSIWRIKNIFLPSGEGERDMVLLQHDIGLELPDKTQVRFIMSYFYCLGY